ncbi:MAG: glycosyltransferase family 4 protein [Anaerolineae bacterium]|nr:glycosyltransferase family 4 protein [Anaerolineae bacterium]
MPGGGVRTQILRTKEQLEKEGVEVLLFDQWRRYDWSHIDLIHVFSTDMRNYFLLRALPSNKPLVVSPIIDKMYPWTLLRGFYLLAGALPSQILTSYNAHRLAVQKAKAFLVRAKYERAILEKGFGVAPCRVFDVPNGVDAKFIWASPERFRKTYGMQGFVLYVGQIGNPRKNLKRLIRVAADLHHVPFVLVGPILQTQEAREVLSLVHRYENIHLLGRLPEEDLLSAYAACHVFVLPSLIEGTGLVALEAGLAGANVVVTRCGGPPDYLGNLAEYVEPKSVRSIRRGIERALQKPKGEKLRKHLAHHYLWEHVIQRLLRVYEHVLS